MINKQLISSIVFALGILVLASPTYAIDVFASTAVCIDNSTLEVNSTILVITDGNSSTVETSQNVSCTSKYGCFSGSCVPASLLNEITFLIVISISVILLLIGYRGGLMPFIMMAGILFLLISVVILIDGIILNGVLYITTTQNLNIFIFGIAMILLGLSIYIMTTSLYAYQSGRK